jgi:hypothetical protein
MSAKTHIHLGLWHYDRLMGSELWVG